MDRIEEVRAWRVSLPLTRPYKLSFGDVVSFESVFVLVRTQQGREALGECTPLPGYTDERIEDVWPFVRDQMAGLPGTDVDAALGSLRADPGAGGFMGTALVMALELCAPSAPVPACGPGRVELIGLLQGDTVDQLRHEAVALYAQGYRTFKCKVGRDVRAETAALSALAPHLPGGVRLRIDANQALSFEDAERLVLSIPAGAVELLEQPFAPDEFGATARLRKLSPIPLMLDESIAGPDDIERARDEGSCDYVKLKLMKCGGFRETADAARRALRLGMGVVLGNGVQSDVGCLYELCLHRSIGLVTAGEMNGFLKQTEPVMEPPLAADGAEAVFGGIAAARLSPGVMERHLVEEASCRI